MGLLCGLCAVIFSWLKSRRRKRLLATPLPDPWEGYLQSNVRHYLHLSPAGRARVVEVARVMVAEKHWSGGGGFEITDEIRVTVSAHAALLTLGLDTPYFFDHVQSVIVHPGAYVHPPQFQSHNLVVHEQMPVQGEAWHHGPIVLSWQHVLEAGRDASDGMNVVLHEFAHHLDGLDGHMEGKPPLANRRLEQTWYRVTEAAYLRLVGNAKRGDVTLLDHYGATNRAEFFAVATECFFERPHAMRRRHAKLYGVLSEFYCQDPAEWLPDAASRASQHWAADTSHRDVEEPATDEDDLVVDPQVLRSTNASELFTWGIAYLDDGQPELAEIALSRALKFDPDDAEALSHRAMARLQMGELDEALADSHEALRLNPNDTQALLTRGGAHVGLGNFEQALENLNGVLADNSNDAEALYLRGVTWNSLNQPRRAVRDLSAAIRREPYDAEAYYHRSQAYRGLGRLRKADADLEKALQLDPHVQE
jgi:Mlc titration factor MtfA (ptsG expression regulator)/Flp pilus assembly protein TadD